LWTVENAADAIVTRIYQLRTMRDKQRGSLFVYNNQWIVACPTTAQEEKHRPANEVTMPKPGYCSNPLVNNDYAAKTVYEVFDRKVNLDIGTIVPQPSTIGVSKKSGVLSPVFFIQRDGTLGIPYEFPVLGQCTLHNATALAPTILRRGNQNMRIRLQVSNLFFPLSCETRARKELAYVFGC
jgi:hypothetical protein